MAKVLTVILLFIVIFNVKFSFLPINSLAIVAPISFICWCISQKSTKLFKTQFKTLGIILGIFILSFGTSVYNNYFDYYFFQEIVLLNILRLFAAYGLSRLLIFSFGAGFNLSKLIKILCGFALIQLFIAYITFFFPEVYYFMARFTTGSELELYKTTGLLGVRPFGIGNYAFFGAGIYNCILLILISYSIAYKINKSSWSLLCYMLVSILGTIIARTTIIGVIFSILFLGVTKYGRKMALKLGLSVILIGIVLGSFNINKNITDKIQELSNFGFELFLNYSEIGKLQTSSSNHMFEDMYFFPKDTDTWVIGDGRFRESESTYYMHTDVGFLRLIYYFGLYGLLLFIFYQYYLIKNACDIFTSNKKVMIFLLLLLIITLNLKGLTDLSFLLFLLININYINGKRPAKSFCNYPNIQS